MTTNTRHSRIHNVRLRCFRCISPAFLLPGAQCGCALLQFCAESLHTAQYVIRSHECLIETFQIVESTLSFQFKIGDELLALSFSAPFLALALQLAHLLVAIPSSDSANRRCSCSMRSLRCRNAFGLSFERGGLLS